MSTSKSFEETFATIQQVIAMWKAALDYVDAMDALIASGAGR